MKFQIQPWDFTLLSSERQEQFEITRKARKSVDKARKKICEHVRDIIPWVKISDIAHDRHINTWAVVILSNYCKTPKELRKALQWNRCLNKVEAKELEDIIRHDFDDEWWFSIWKAHSFWIKIEKRLEIKREEAEREEERKKKWMNWNK